MDCPAPRPVQKLGREANVICHQQQASKSRQGQGDEHAHSTTVKKSKEIKGETHNRQSFSSSKVQVHQFSHLPESTPKSRYFETRTRASMSCLRCDTRFVNPSSRFPDIQTQSGEPRQTQACPRRLSLPKTTSIGAPFFVLTPFALRIRGYGVRSTVPMLLRPLKYSVLTYAAPLHMFLLSFLFL